MLPSSVRSAGTAVSVAGSSSQGLSALIGALSSSRSPRRRTGLRPADGLLHVHWPDGCNAYDGIPGPNRASGQATNRAKAVRRLSREHARIVNLRDSFLHEVSSQLAKTHSRLVIEDLQSANLLANRRLARAVGDAGWAKFARQLTYKARWLDGELVVCDRWFPSTKACHACGKVKEHMELAERIFRCSSCGLTCDRDRNAAANLAAWAERVASLRTAKQAAGSTTPLEGMALAIASPMVEPGPMKGGTNAQAVA
jgi:Putative transposase DNA-binding domain/Probable transposase